MEVLFLAFKKIREGRRAILAYFVFQVTLAQNDLYAKLAYLGVAYSATFQLLGLKLKCSCFIL